MATWISLLRAVNLGATNKVSMPVLRERLAEAGFRDVRTYVQSGNIVARSGHRSEKAVARAVNAVIAEHFDLDVPVIVRTPDQMAKVLAFNPFPKQAEEAPKLVAVSFHTDPIRNGEEIEELGAAVGEQVRVEGRELYIAYSAGVHSSKLTPAALRKRLGQEGTARNWRTVKALVAMTSSAGGRTRR